MKNIRNTVVADSCFWDWKFSKDCNMRFADEVSRTEFSLDICIGIDDLLCVNCSSKEELINDTSTA
jgi:hypothetical protein